MAITFFFWSDWAEILQAWKEYKHLLSMLIYISKMS